jgi:hypothetical protein
MSGDLDAEARRKVGHLPRNPRGATAPANHDLSAQADITFS